jgi:hypothetical protein
VITCRFDSPFLEFQQQTVQIWVGTTYGSVIVLNSTSYSNDSKSPTSLASSNNGNSTNNNQNIKPATLITPSGVVHSLKGQIVDIAFLDINGNLLNPNHMERKFKENKDAQDGLDNNDENFLDIDYSFLTNNSMSNSIADNFYGNQSSSSNPAASAVATTTTTATMTNSNNNNGSNQLVNNASGTSLSESYLSSSPHTPNALTEEPKISHKTSKSNFLKVSFRVFFFFL